MLLKATVGKADCATKSYQTSAEPVLPQVLTIPDVAFALFNDWPVRRLVLAIQVAAVVMVVELAQVLFPGCAKTRFVEKRDNTKNPTVGSTEF